MTKANGRGAGATWARWVVAAAVFWAAAASVAPPSVSAGPWPGSGAGEEYGPRRSAYLAEAVYRQPPAAPPPRKTMLRRMRANTIDLGLQISYGTVRGTSRLADGFNSGFGYAFRFRYQIKPSFAFGISFENQHFNASSNNPPSNEPFFTDSSVVMTTVAAEAIFYVHRERTTNPYFLGGFGHASPDIVYEPKESTRVNDGMFLVLGAGLEHFVREKLSLDFALRGYGLVSNSEFTSFLQFCAGVQVYPGD
jgi:outer membrane protein with beta-barrel domain